MSMLEDQSSHPLSEQQKIPLMSHPQLTDEGLQTSTVGTKNKLKKKKQQLEGVNRGHWTVQENKLYHWFLEIHYQHFVKSHLRRTDKIFKTMEQFVGTRQAEQCRSHHQKMEKKYRSFPAILKSLREHHYASEEPLQVQDDMTLHEVTFTHVLPSIAELLSMSEAEPLVPPNTPRRKSKKCEVVVEQIPIQQAGEEAVLGEQLQGQPFKQEQQGGHKINMFEQCHNANLGDISLHLKEDSYPFQFNFHHE